MKSYRGGRVEPFSTLVGLGQLLIAVKLSRKASLRSRDMDKKKYDKFCDDVCALYRLLDAASVEELERIK